MQESYLSEFNQQKVGTSPLENGDRTRFYFQKLLNIEHSLSSIVAINIALMVIYVLFGIYRVGKLIITKLKLLPLWMSYCMLYSVALLQKLSYQYQGLNVNFNYKNNKSCSTQLKDYGVVEEYITYLVKQSYFQFNLIPILNISNHQYYFYVNQILCIVCLFRVYVFGRALLMGTTYMNPRSSRICRLHGCQATYQYALKCLFKDRPSSLILLGFGASIVIFGFAIHLCQRPLVRSQLLPTNLGLFENAIWLTIQTMTTVGYGDLYPYTILGKTIILIIVVWGIFIVPIMVVVVTNTLQMQKAQVRTLIVLNRLSISSQLRQLSADFIASVIKARKQTNIKKLQKRKKDILRLKQKFKKKNLQLKGLQFHDDTYQQMSRKFQQLNEDIKILNRNQQELYQDGNEVDNKQLNTNKQNNNNQKVSNDDYE